MPPMRMAFLALAALNLLFLGWAHWVDSPQEGLPRDGLTRLPRLQLVTEKPSSSREEGSTRKMTLRLPAWTCTSVGPFGDAAGAGRMTAALSERGYTAVQRTEDGEKVDGYWVYVTGMKTEQDVATVIDKLQQGGFTDARAMNMKSPGSAGRRVSVGLFSKRDRAERRAWAVQHSIGLQPEIGERTFPGTVYWVDVDARLGVPELASGLTSSDDLLRVGMQECPGAHGVQQAAAGSHAAETALKSGMQREAAKEISRPLRSATAASAPQPP